MPTPKRTKSQIKSDRAKLRKLRASGLFRGKIDLRKPPNSRHRKALKEFADVISGKATVVKPRNPRSYRSLFDVKGDKVIVPRRKGERVRVDKQGNITSTRKVGGRTVKAKFQRSKRGEKIARPSEEKQYAIPFIRGRDKKGRPIVHWFRFPSYDDLAKFMAGYDYKDWTDYVVEEELDAGVPDDIQEQYRTGSAYRRPKGADRHRGQKVRRRGKK